MERNTVKADVVYTSATVKNLQRNFACDLRLTENLYDSLNTFEHLSLDDRG